MTLDDLVSLLVTMGKCPSLDVVAVPGGSGSAAVAGAAFTELDHGLQCARRLAQAAPSDLELQVAALVHDVGHRFGDDEAHGRLGAEALRPLLGDRVAALVAGHVPAKRYLVAVRPGYAEVLSPVSTHTLGEQGGRMSAEEVVAFRRQAHWEAAVELRLADDRAKVPGRVVPSLEHWLPKIRSLAAVR